MPVEITNGARGCRVDVQVLRRQAQRLLKAVGSPEATLSLLLTDDRKMSELHERWMGEKGPTDVLAFPQMPLFQQTAGTRADLYPILGDIVISVETARRVNPDDPAGEIRRYLVHGLLHLMGYDHGGRAESRLMDRKTEQLLRLLRG